MRRCADGVNFMICSPGILDPTGLMDSPLSLTGYDEQHKRLKTSVPRLSMQEVSRKYRVSNCHLVILDYEGTLVSWGPNSHIIPVSPQRTLNVLNDLLLDDLCGESGHMAHKGL